MMLSGWILDDASELCTVTFIYAFLVVLVLLSLKSMYTNKKLFALTKNVYFDRK